MPNADRRTEPTAADSHCDQLRRFLFDHTDIRGEIVTLESSYREVLSHNPLPPAVARQLGDVNVLDSEEVGKLMQIRERLGIRGPDPACLVDIPGSTPSSAPSAPPDGGIPTRRARSAASSGPAPSQGPDEELIAEITRRVIAELRKG